MQAVTHIEDITGSLFPKMVDDFKARGDRLLNRVSEDEQKIVTRTLARIVEEQGLALVSDNPDRNHANISQLTNTLKNISAKYGLDAQYEVREFVQNLVQKAAETAVAATFAFVPAATKAIASVIEPTDAPAPPEQDAASQGE